MIIRHTTTVIRTFTTEFDFECWQKEREPIMHGHGFSDKDIGKMHSPEGFEEPLAEEYVQTNRTIIRIEKDEEEDHEEETS